MYCNDKNKVLISKSFKTASSSLYELLREHVGQSHGLLKDNHFYPKLWREMLDFERDEITMIVGIRNPWDYVSSAYHWSLMNNECPSDYTFKDFVFKKSDFNWQKQLQWWDVNEIDDVIVFENLREEVNRIASIYDIKEIYGKPLRHLKRSKNSTTVDYRNVYDEESKQYVEEVFEEQIEFFKENFGVYYTFENIL